MMDSLAGLYGQMGILGSMITGLIIVLFIGGFYVNVLVRRRYLSLSEELVAFCSGEISELRSELLAWITEEYKASLDSGVEVINTGAIMDMAFEAYQKPCMLGESYLKKVNGLLITMGLFGTFVGLTSALGNIGSMMSQTNAETLMAETGVTTFKVLFSSFEGMSVAFITSLFGTGFSILLSILTIFIGAGDAKKLFITQLEEYLDIKLVSEFMETATKKDHDRSDEINILSNTLADSIILFNKTVCTYTEELQSLKDFNKEFSHNLAQADRSVSTICHSLDKTSETAYQTGIRFFSCSETLNSLVKEIEGENRRLESMSELLADLSQKLDESTQDRQIFLQVVNEIPDKLLNYNEAAVARIERGR